MLTLYMDHHVHRAITEGLRRRGIDVVTAWEDGTEEQEDEYLLERAVELGRILVTQDQDFLGIAMNWQKSNRNFPGMVYAIQQDVDVGGTIEYLELVVLLKSADEMRNQIEYVPTR
jgi:hypothetical protein